MAIRRNVIFLLFFNLAFLLRASFVFSQGDCPKENNNHVFLEYDNTRIDVLQTCWRLHGNSVPLKKLTVEIENPGKKKKWEFQGSSIAAEGWDATSWPVVIYGKYLFIQKYSGGASCCWSMLAFDLDRLKYLGDSVASQTTIDYDYRTKYADSSCHMGIWGTEITSSYDRPLAERIQYCFNGKKFFPAKSKAE